MGVGSARPLPGILRSSGEMSLEVAGLAGCEESAR